MYMEQVWLLVTLGEDVRILNDNVRTDAELKSIREFLGQCNTKKCIQMFVQNYISRNVSAPGNLF